VFLFNATNEVTQTLYVRDKIPAVERRAIIERLMQEGLVGWVVREQQTALVVDTQADARWLSMPTGDNDSLGTGRAGS